MEKIKVDILILGDLVCEQKLTGGGKIYPCRKENIDELFDTNNALVIDGDVVVDNFNSKEYTVVVTGAVASKGGRDGRI